MKLRELRVGNESAWINPAKAYWDNEIHIKCVAEGWTNEDAMKTDAHSYIDALQTAYTGYKSGADVNALNRALLVIYGHVSMKYNMVVADDPPVIPVIITGDDIRNFYLNWSLDLTDHEDIFILEGLVPPEPEPEEGGGEEGGEEGDPEPITEGVVTKTSDYLALESSISGGASTDSALLISIETSLAGNIRPFMINQLFAKPTTSSNNLDIKDFILETMILQDVLDEFGFEIKGINV